MSAPRTPLIAVFAAAALAHVGTAQVRWRAGCDPGAAATPIDLGPQGVRVSTPGSGERVIPLDCVADVEGPMRAQWAPLAEEAELAWRGRARLERGDFAGAEDLLEPLYIRHAAEPGPFSTRLARAVMSCRLARGALTQAVHPMLGVAGGEPVAPPRVPTGPGELDPELLYDDAWGLSPLLAPIFVRLPAVQALAHGPWPASPDRGGRGPAISAAFEAAAKFETGLPVSLGPRPTSDAGAALAYDVVAARAGNPEQVAAARAALRERLSQPGPDWVNIWCRTALGRSMISDPDPDTRWLGVAELLRVPAMSERSQPYLTGICLAHAAVTLDQLGDTRGAATIARQFEARFPGHPVLQWEPLQRIAARPQADPARPAPQAPPTTSGDPP
ncbi:MAG: hypothetical protein DYG92_11770 [Leptolyngbya sp. PLA1]|nr:hypothetical protein [Leptolyngbya sp. PLA1]